MSNKDYETYNLGDFKLQSGEILPNAFIAYKTYGDPKNPLIVYPTWYSGLISSNEWLISPSFTLNPQEYFILIPALFGNSESSSPSNNPSRPWPIITFHDNVRAQHTLVTQHLGITHAFAILGWSMGAGQTFQWATQYPDFMDCIVPFCGSARTSLHNRVMLEGVKSALVSARGNVSKGVCEGVAVGDARKGEGWTQEEKTTGLKALGRVYAGWGFSQAFYREKVYSTHLNYPDLESFMKGFWEGWALSKDPENMLAMLDTWQHGDCSAQEPYHGDFEKAMKGIKAKALVIPSKTDLYFPPEDSEIEVKNMAPGIGRLEIFPSIWGHWAGGPGDSKEDVQWLDEKLREFFEGVKGAR